MLENLLAINFFEGNNKIKISYKYFLSDFWT